MDDRVRDGILFLIALILSVAVHEFGHAWAATRLGDSLPRAQGRLTLNPIRHVDPIGTLLFPVMMMAFGGGMLGWGRPVQTNPYNYTRRFSQATGSALVAVAGPAMNLFLAVLVSAMLVIGARFGLVTFDLAQRHHSQPRQAQPLAAVLQSAAHPAAGRRRGAGLGLAPVDAGGDGLPEPLGVRHSAGPVPAARRADRSSWARPTYISSSSG